MTKIQSLGYSPNTPMTLNLLDAEDMLVEVQKVKHQLQQEMAMHKRYQD